MLAPLQPKPQQASRNLVLDRVLLGVTAVAAFTIALLVRNDKNSSTLALVLTGLAGLLAILAMLLPYLKGLSGSVGGVSLDLSFVVARPEGLLESADTLSGHLDPVTGKATVTRTGRTALSEVVQGPDVEYAVISLGKGDKWLASRLLIFTVVMKELRLVRYIVVTTASGPDGRERFLGLVTMEDIRRAFAWEYPWLEAALFEAWQAVTTTPGTQTTPPILLPVRRVTRLSPGVAEHLYNDYVLRIRPGPPVGDTAEWTELQVGDWEHSPMLRDDHLATILGESLDTRAASSSRSRSSQLTEVLRIGAP